MRTVHIYSGSLALVSKSGVGQAAKHQRAALESVGVHVVTDWDCRAEVVHINTVLPVSLWAARHARRRGQKVIWYGHSTEKDFRNSFTGSNLLAPLFKQWLRLCYNQADLIITPTPYSAKELAGYRLRPTIVPLSNGVDTRFFAPNPASRSILREKYRLAADKSVVISVEHYMQRKGILDFIALAKCRRCSFCGSATPTRTLCRITSKPPWRMHRKTCGFRAFSPRQSCARPTAGRTPFCFAAMRRPRAS